MRALVALSVGVCTASCGETATLTPSERAAAECARIVDGDWVGELEGNTFSARLSYVGAFGCLRGGEGVLNEVEADWSWRQFGGSGQYSFGRFIYRPDSPDPDSISLRLLDSSHCQAQNGLEAFFAGPDRLEGTVTFWLSEVDSFGDCSDSPLVDLEDVPVELVRARGG